MGAYQGRIAGIRGRNEPVSERGFAFSAEDPTALARFRRWMGLAERELFSTFVILILFSVVITTLLVAETVGTDRADLAGNLTSMVLEQAQVLRGRGGAWLEIVFLLGGALVLFSTQVGIVDTVTRITGDIFYERVGRRNRRLTLKRTFLFLLTLFVLASMGVIVLSWVGGESLGTLEPDFLVLVAGPFTIASMLCFTAVILDRVLGLSGDVVSTMAFHPVRAAVYVVWLAALAWVVARTFRPGWLARAQEP
jgi:TRAP-type mannitol/chloroaromatic compound transport system permease small subunit